MIHDADVPLLFVLVIAAAIVVAPSVQTIVEMAATSAAIGVSAHALVGLFRLAFRSCRAPRRAVPQQAP